jgi:hypothetical protein
MWGFVGMKEKAKGNLYKNVDVLGDAYTYVAIERNSKLILAWHLGKRSRPDTLTFILALHFAYYNLCRVHSSLRVTPGMEAGLTDHIMDGSGTVFRKLMLALRVMLVSKMAICPFSQMPPLRNENA